MIFYYWYNQIIILIIMTFCYWYNYIMIPAIIVIFYLLIYIKLYIRLSWHYIDLYILYMSADINSITRFVTYYRLNNYRHTIIIYHNILLYHDIKFLSTKRIILIMLSVKLRIISTVYNFRVNHITRV